MGLKMVSLALFMLKTTGCDPDSSQIAGGAG
jgi:hypothetical protein